MTNAKNTKRALLMSVLSMMLCMAMLVGSTFAWFTDSVTSGMNKIVAGNLDIELEYATEFNDDGSVKTWTAVDSDTKLFSELEPDGETANLWEPGHTEVVYLKISNVGSLALKYQFTVTGANETRFTNALGEENCKLSDYLVFGKAEKNDKTITKYADRQTAWGDVGDVCGLNEQELAKTNDLLKAGESEYLALVVYMPTTIGNEANYRGDVIPSIDLGVNLVATQTPYESDSFGKDYDANVEYPVTTSKDLSDALEKAESGDKILLSKGSYEMPAECAIAEGVSIIGTPGTVLNVTGGKKDITKPDPETGITQGLLLKNDNITISGVTITGDVRNATGDQYTGYNALVRITGNNVTLDNVTLDSKTNDSPIVIANTAGDNNNITIKDCTITAAFKAIHIVDGAKGTVTIDGCKIDAMYPFNVNTNSKLSMSVKNSVLNGYTSYGESVIKAVFDNCEFGNGYMISYADTDFINCTFNDGFNVYTKNTVSKTMTFMNCNKAGTAITSENVKSLFDPNDSDSIATAGWKIIVDSVNLDEDNFGDPFAGQ